MPAPARRWTFLTNHARVLLEVARDPAVRLRDVAAAIEITERATQAIVADLEGAGYLRRTRVGRRNHYTVNATGLFRHPNEAGYSIAALLDIFVHREHSDTLSADAGGEKADGQDDDPEDPAAYVG